ncbi:MAG: hypothetical protein ACFB0F_09865 [Neomegalonema sp.]
MIDKVIKYFTGFFNARRVCFDILLREQVSSRYIRMPRLGVTRRNDAPPFEGSWQTEGKIIHSSRSVLVFTQSSNQSSVLLPALDAISKKDVEVNIIINNYRPAIESWKIKIHQLSYYQNRWRWAALLLLLSAPFKALRYTAATRKQSSRAIHGLFVDILAMREAISRLQPDLVLLSNDHLVLPRTMVLVARHSGVPTAYVQHASVSDVFPRLSFDYAFLDGRTSAEVYASCAGNHSPNTILHKVPAVFLSGVQRPVETEIEPDRKTIGVTVNNVDNIDAILACCDALLAANLCLVMRWHPRQKSERVAKIRSWLSAHPGVLVSDPSVSNVAEFFSQSAIVLGGDSTILLEAAIAGRLPLYFRSGDALPHDYYGYVERGIVRECETTDEILETVRSGWRPSSEALRQMSATFGTNWQGREGELLACALHRILNGDSLEGLYQRGQPCPPFEELYLPS